MTAKRACMQNWMEKGKTKEYPRLAARIRWIRTGSLSNTIRIVSA